MYTSLNPIQVLKDDETRKVYDQHGEEGLKEKPSHGGGYHSWNYYNQEFGGCCVVAAVVGVVSAVVGVDVVSAVVVFLLLLLVLVCLLALLSGVNVDGFFVVVGVDVAFVIVDGVAVVTVVAVVVTFESSRF